MTVHVVQNGDTLDSIANQYNIPRSKIEMDNNLVRNDILNIGQAIMIVPAEQTYTVKEGDTLTSIAEMFGTSIIQLLRDNPEISDRNTINTGDELVISYHREKEFSVMGYSTVFINEKILRKTLPYLTYIIIMNYKVDALGDINDINDAAVLNLASEYGVAPVMFLSSMVETGRGSYASTHAILNNLDIQNQLIENVLEIMGTKGYVGLDLAFYSIIQDDIPLYIDFVARVTKRLNETGYEVYVTLTPQLLRYQSGINYEKTYYADFGRAANKVILITYLWQQSYINMVSQTTANFYKELLDFVVTQIPPEKIYIGLTRIAYDWELPYVEGESFGSSLTNAGAINLANQLGSQIEFDETTQTPFFYYNSAGVDHFVWFKDVRSVNAILTLVDQYGLAGVAVWNIMYYYSQTWLSLNSQYKIKFYEPKTQETTQ